MARENEKEKASVRGRGREREIEKEREREIEREREGEDQEYFAHTDGGEVRFDFADDGIPIIFEYIRDIACVAHRSHGIREFAWKNVASRDAACNVTIL